MKLLGLSAGATDGSAEILLKHALRGAEGAGAQIELVRLGDLVLTTGPGAASDDADWFWDRLMETDGLIVSSPIYSRTIPGLLRLLGDKISGPQSDVAFTSELLRLRAEGASIAVDFAIDERVLRPRVAGFIAVGGSLPPRWKTLALPLMHTLTASAQIAVVVVTHNLPLCFAVADRIVVLNRGRKVADVATSETDNDAVVGWITGAKPPQPGLERMSA